MIQPIIQRIINSIPGWQRDFLTYPGRELLIKSVLSATQTYFLTTFKKPKWAYNKIGRFRRTYLWRGQDNGNDSGGHCLENW
jgi:hypothetical protein